MHDVSGVVNRGTMKHLSLLLLCAVLLCWFVPAGWCADPAGDAGSGFIVVTNPPVADFYTSNWYGAGPFMVSFSDRSRGAEPMTWHWDFGDGTTSDRQNPAHTYTKAGFYFVTLRVSNHFGSDGLTKSAFIKAGNPQPLTPVTPPVPEKKRPEGFAGLVQEARGSMDKNLPTSGLIPPR